MRPPYLQTHGPLVGEQLRLKHEENNKNDLRAVAVVKFSIWLQILKISGFKYRRRLNWHGKYSCSASYDNFLSNVYTREMQPLCIWHDICYDDIISVSKYNFCKLQKTSHSQLLDYYRSMVLHFKSILNFRRGMFNKICRLHQFIQLLNFCGEVGVT